MSIFNEAYKDLNTFAPVNLYNWSIEFILDGNAYAAMNNEEYNFFGKHKRLTWEEQSEMLSFMCKKCNLPKKKISEVKTYCRGMEASFNAGITIDSSLSLSFDESSSRIITQILNKLSNYYSNTTHILNNVNTNQEGAQSPNSLVYDGKRENLYSKLNKVGLHNEQNHMIGGHNDRTKNLESNLKDYYFENDDIKNGRFTGDNDYSNRDLTIVVKLYGNKYGYMNPNEIYGEDILRKEFIFTKCFINNLKFGDNFDYSSEDNLTIDCEIMYNWYNTREEFNTLEAKKVSSTEQAQMKEQMKGYKPNNSMDGYNPNIRRGR